MYLPVKFKRILALLLLSYLLPFLYCIISQFWHEHGGSSGTLNLFEYPLLVCLSLLLYFSPGEDNKIVSKHIFSPLLVILGIYVFHDIFYSFFQRAPRISDIKNYPALFTVSLPLALSAIAFAITIFGPAVYFAVKSCLSNDRLRARVSIIQVVLIVALLGILASPAVYEYQKQNLQFVDWSTTRNIRKNGRIASFLYMHNKRKETIGIVKKSPRISIPDYFYTDKPQKTADIHIIVLESFIDPEHIRNLSFSPSPLYPGLSPFLLNGTSFSLVESPVYGGGTAQAEFELLTGVPALSLVESIEFNLFEGTETSSFVNKMNKLGYHTMASIGTKAKFYNSKNAYKGLGFKEIFFIDDGYFKKAKGDEFIFDGDLLDFNLKYLEKPDISAGPVLNYIVGMFGHLPYDRNLKTRPDVITVNTEDQALRNITNQYYYRTMALSRFIRKLQETDREAIILIISDHLPSIFNGSIRYKHKNTSNIALLLNSLQPVDINSKKYYELPHIIWNLLCENPNPAASSSHTITSIWITKKSSIIHLYGRQWLYRLNSLIRIKPLASRNKVQRCFLNSLSNALKQSKKWPGYWRISVWFVSLDQLKVFYFFLCRNQKLLFDLRQS